MVPLGLHCCVQAFSSCSEKGGCSLSWFTDFSLLWLPSWSKALGTQASGVSAFQLSSCSSWTVELRLSSRGTKAFFAPWHVLPRPGIKCVFPALAGGFHNYSLLPSLPTCHDSLETTSQEVLSLRASCELASGGCRKRNKTKRCFPSGSCLVR